MTERTLSPLEYAILRAVVELGDGAYGVPISQHVQGRYRLTFYGELYTVLNRLEEEGFVRSFEGEATPERGNRPKRYWRPAYDLTEFLKGQEL